LEGEIESAGKSANGKLDGDAGIVGGAADGVGGTSEARRGTGEGFQRQRNGEGAGEVEGANESAGARSGCGCGGEEIVRAALLGVSRRKRGRDASRADDAEFGCAGSGAGSDFLGDYEWSCLARDAGLVEVAGADEVAVGGVRQVVGIEVEGFALRRLRRFGGSWVEVGENPHPLKSEGAAPRRNRGLRIVNFAQN